MGLSVAISILNVLRQQDCTNRLPSVDSPRHLSPPPEAIARAIAFAMEQPEDVDVNEIVVRSTAQA